MFSVSDNWVASIRFKYRMTHAATIIESQTWKEMLWTQVS